MWGRRRKEEELADAKEEARRWYERLGGQIANLSPGDSVVVKQALVDASERYAAAGGQLQRAESPRQCEFARETALEGLSYIRAARTAMGLDPGPAVPALAAQRGVGAITQPRAIDVDGRQFRASPQPQADTPYYYPGGRIQGRPVPTGWYSEPWWKGALATGAGVFGGMLLFDALAGGFGGGYGGGSGYDQGYQQGLDYADAHGWDPNGSDGSGGSGSDQSGSDSSGNDQSGSDQSGSDQSGVSTTDDDPSAIDTDQGGYDQSGYDQGGYDQGGLDQGGYDNGGFDGGGFDGGFDGGGFDGGDFGGF